LFASPLKVQVERCRSQASHGVMASHYIPD
jgi:hypothetical protein